MKRTGLNFLIGRHLINFDDEQDPNLGSDNQESNNDNNDNKPSVIEPPNWLVNMNQVNHARLQTEEENRRLKEQLAALSTRNEVPTLEPGDTFNSPQKLVNTIQALLDQQIKPLKDEFSSYRRVQAYNDLKAKVKLFYPQFAAQFTQIEPLVDQEMSGKDPTEFNLTQAIQLVIGRLALNNPGMFQQQQPPQNNNQQPPQNRQQVPLNNSQQNNQDVLPPHLRPSNIRQSTPTNKPKRDYDENERRLIRESGLTEDEWDTLQSANPSELNKVYKEIMEKRKGGNK